jgi:FrmR/RcnR family transcriptional regulator, repressor of rcnA expression
MAPKLVLAICFLLGSANSPKELDSSRTVSQSNATRYIGYPVRYHGGGGNVSHTKREKLKLLNRIRRVRGQVEAVERALEEEQGCAAVLHLIVAARGALNSLMTEVIEDHIRLHLVDGAKVGDRARGAEELIEAVQSYLK